jgi:hypothetical protein
VQRVETTYSTLEPYSYLHSPALAAVEFIVLPFYLWAFYGCSVKRIYDVGFKSFAAISRGEAPKPLSLPQAMYWLECFLPFIGGLLVTLSIYGTIRDYHNFGTGKIVVIVDNYGDETDFRIMSTSQWVEDTNAHNLLEIDKARHGDPSGVITSGYSTWSNWDASESNFNPLAAMRGAWCELKAQLLTAIFFTLLPVLWPLVAVIIAISLVQIFLMRFFERHSHYE